MDIDDARETVERYFRAVYGGDLEVVGELAAEDIVVSYPVFSTLFGRPVMRGLQECRELSTNFRRTWANPEITVHASVAEGRRVVLVWSFSGRRSDSSFHEAAEHSWGGISVFEVDSEGRVLSEIGEESDPGPHGRFSK